FFFSSRRRHTRSKRDWSSDVCSSDLRFVSRLVRRVAVFNWNKTDHDVLKVLYESVIRADTRKHLGEYYTPDWLAEGIVDKAVSSPLTQRVLDGEIGRAHV